MEKAQANELIEQAVLLLQRGDGGRAAPLLRQAMACEGVQPPWLLLAQASRLAGDEAGEADALRGSLAVEAGNLRALLMRGDWYERAGDGAQAMNFRRAALARVQPGAQLASDLIQALRRAEAWMAERVRTYEGHLRGALAAAGHPPERLSPRLSESLEILAGRAQPQFQQPKSFFFAGLPQIAFYERELFPWAEAVEAAADEVRAELAAAEAEAFTPYVVAGARADARHKLLNDPAWSALHLFERGQPVAGAAERFPRTLAALCHAPQPVIRGRSPTALFSRLGAGAHIPPHQGLLNTRLIAHLPLVVPDGCRLRVGNHVRTFETDRLWVFDDSMDHEAWNDSGEARTVLIFEIWRPELSAEERSALTAMFEAAEAYGATLPRDA